MEAAVVGQGEDPKVAAEVKVTSTPSPSSSRVRIESPKRYSTSSRVAS
jgi:hypothetical protein